jgi:hypothetical protein
MAEILLNEHARMRLARILNGRRCPNDIDRKTYQAIQRGDRFVVSIRILAALAAAYGDSVLQAVPGLNR